MTDKQITISINNQEISCQPNERILDVAIRNGIDIPHFCYHEDLPVSGGCRTCLVENVKTKQILTSCTLKAKDGLQLLTNSHRVNKARLENLELLLANHKKTCPLCQKDLFCQTHELMKSYQITGEKYQKPKINKPIHKMVNAIEYDPQACIGCGACVRACQKIGIGFINLKDKGAKRTLNHSQINNVDCIYCGQCAVHCPVGAIREQTQIDQVNQMIDDPDKIVIAQMAPTIRVSIGEEFGLEPGTDMTAQTYTALRNLRFDKVFDVNMGADITTMVEAEELVERINNNGKLPMFTSCCPAWVKFLEFYHPQLIPHLTTSRSPQIHVGAAYKTWWAEKENIDPKKIIVVSIMPCTSKKYEASFEELNIDGLKPVDYVLTTRELATMLKAKQIDLPNLQKSTVDHYGEYSGAAAIYGASGGVMESALRTAAYMLTGKNLDKLEFKAVRGMNSIKKTTVEIAGKKLKLAVVTTPKSARQIIIELKKDPHAYDYIEFMACPGGCIGGGGQPIPTTDKIVEKRRQGLYKLDDNSTIRTAHDNPIVKDFFDYLEKQPKEKKHSILHRNYSQKKKYE